MTKAQQKALNPLKNVWVTASAGSGKTKVLTDRLLRLMLEGTEPQKLLCLTFTKAAAAEMLQRLQSRLSEWASCAEDSLAEQVAQLLSRPPSLEILKRARGLFFLFLDHMTPIQTLHSFCQHLLQRFPLEAGLSIPFRVLEEQDSLSLFRLTFQNLEKNPPPLIEEVWLQLYETQSDAQIAEHIEELFLKRMFLSEKAGLVIPPSLHEEKELVFQGTALQRLQEILLKKGTEKDWIVFHRLSTLERFSPDYVDLFLTQAYQPRKHLFSAAVEKALPDLPQWTEKERASVLSHQEHLTLMQLIHLSKHYRSLFEALLQRYEAAKQEKGWLDFNDLILKATELIRSPQNMGWVLFKLDHSIEHLLVDEAQDTSIEQWSLIRSVGEALMTTGSGKKTLFIVGDPKQSIYSFQRADLTMFHETRTFFKECAAAVGAPFEDVFLDTSFRSTQPILSLLNQTFGNCSLAHDPYVAHQPCPMLSEKGGHIEFWPLWEGPKGDRLLAEEWAYQVSLWLKEPFFLETQGRLLEPKDIMILMGKRDRLFEELLTAFQRYHIPITGHDRQPLQTQLAIQDLLKVAEFTLMPEDDWTTACVLRGTLLGCEEDLLEKLAKGRGRSSLFERMAFDPEATSFHAQLCLWKRLAMRLSPFEFFHTLLYDLKGMEKILSRLGDAVQESLEIFLATVLSFEKKHGNSLVRCLQAFQQHPLLIKRDASTFQEIRLMTIHGAKGLEAPVVILPNICQNTGMEDAFYYTPQAWLAPKKNQQLSITRALEEKRTSDIQEEHDRLLYVAMTRAKERLYCSGLKPPKTHRGWLGLLKPAFQKQGMPFAFQAATSEAWKGEGYRYHQKGESIPSGQLTPLIPPLPQPFETHAFFYEKEEGSFVFKSYDESSKHQVLGQLVHQLLDEIAHLPEKRRPQACFSFLRQQGYTKQVSTFWTDCILKTISAFPSFFAQNSKNELTVFCQKTNSLLRVDKVIKTDSSLAIIDYKIDRQIPQRWQDVSPSYQHQLEAYRTAFEEIYPMLPIRIGLLWIRKQTILWKS